MSETVLLDIGSTALAHQGEVDEVKKRLGISHNYFDCWIYGFLENKNFNIDEGVAKLKRREEFEKTELLEIEITDWMMESMRMGIIQVIGNDKEGRVALYVTTHRDKPTKAHRLEARKNFDMFVSYATRLRQESKRCQLVMLINQDQASVFSNVDMTFQADIALRIAKFYPGCVDRLYICKMNGTLAAFAKPVFSRLPAIVSDRIRIISNSDIQNGKLLELFDEDVLPVALGGKNTCDNQENYNRFAETISSHFLELREGIAAGMSVKDWELMKLRNAGVLVESSSKIDTLRRNFTDSTLFAGNKSMSSMGDRGGLDDSTDELYTCNSFDALTGTTMQMVRANELTSTDFMESTENFFRVSITEGCDREWLDIVKTELRERAEIEKQSGEIHNESLLAPLSPSVRLFSRGFLWLCMTVMSIYFLVGTIVISVVGVTNMAYLLFSTMYKAYYVFPYGAALMITAAQFAIFVSRGFELTTNVYNGELILPLRALGSRAHFFQLSICIVTVLTSFVIFCVFAAKEGAYYGFQCSFSFGWFAAACLIFIYHVVFAFGFKEITKRSYADGSRVNNPETTIYLFLDVSIDNHVRRRPTMEVITGCILAVLSFAFGLSFILSDQVLFLCCCVVAHAGLHFVAIMSTFIQTSAASSNAALSSASFGSIVWINAVVVLSQNGWNDGWGASVLTAAIVSFVFLVISFLTLFGAFRDMRGLWALRAAWIYLLLLHAVCLIILFTLDYKCGIFSLALAIHLLVCVMRSTEATNPYGIFCTIFGFTIILLMFFLMGKWNMDEQYSSSVSGVFMSHYKPEPAPEHFTPLCKTIYTGAHNTAFNVVGAALFAKLGYNSNDDAQAQDLEHWFPNLFDVAGHYNTVDGDIRVSTFQSKNKEVMVFSFGFSNDLTLAIESITMWIETYPVSFLSLIAPSSVLVNTLQYATFMKDLCPLTWKRTIPEVQQHIEDVWLDDMNKAEYVYFVGHATMGVVASSLALSFPKTFAVLFSTPFTLVMSSRVNEEDIGGMMISLFPGSSFFFPWRLSSTTQIFPCPQTKSCDKLDVTIDSLDMYCNA